MLRQQESAVRKEQGEALKQAERAEKEVLAAAALQAALGRLRLHVTVGDCPSTVLTLRAGRLCLPC